MEKKNIFLLPKQKTIKHLEANLARNIQALYEEQITLKLYKGRLQDWTNTDKPAS